MMVLFCRLGRFVCFGHYSHFAHFDGFVLLFRVLVHANFVRVASVCVVAL